MNKEQYTKAVKLHQAISADKKVLSDMVWADNAYTKALHKNVAFHEEQLAKLEAEAFAPNKYLLIAASITIALIAICPFK